MTNSTFVAISDVHLNPFAGIDRHDHAAMNAWVTHLASTPLAKWPSTLSTQQPTATPAGSGTDANYALGAAAIDHAAAAVPSPDFVLYPGDFMKHNIWGPIFNARLDARSQRAVFRNTVQVLFDAITDAWPKTPIYLTFGNDDSYIGDYALRAGGDLLSDVAAIAKNAMHGTEIDFGSFTELGCYSAKLPKVGHRLISLANVFWSVSRPSPQPAAKQVLGYLDAQLAQAASANETVWLMMHIPPFGNGYVAGHRHPHFTSGKNWQSEFQDEFQKTIDRHDVAIEFAFSGHTHMDDLRFVMHNRAGTTTPFINKIVPGVSPLFGQNPAYQVFTASGGAVTDWKTVYCGAGTQAGWHHYEAAATYGAVDAASLLNTFETMYAKGTHGSDYLAQYKVMRNAIPATYLQDFVQQVLAGVPSGTRPTVAYPLTTISAEEAMAEQNETLG